MARLPLTKSLSAVKQSPPPNNQEVEAGGSADAESFHLARLPSGPEEPSPAGDSSVLICSSGPDVEGKIIIKKICPQPTGSVKAAN